MNTHDFDWKSKYSNLVGTAAEAMKLIKPGDSIFIGTACGQPQHLVDALVEHSEHIFDAHIIHLLTMGSAPYASEKFQEKFDAPAEEVKGMILICLNHKINLMISGKTNAMIKMV